MQVLLETASIRQEKLPCVGNHLQEVWSAKPLCSLPGQTAIADDILVFGSGDTDGEVFIGHDRHL